jgi:signal transduction histidine kinase/ActR/RegA family two-component response regulator
LSKVRLRTKFLLSLLAISAGLTSATLLIVSYSVQKRVRESIREQLRDSVNTYQSFEKQRDEALAKSALLLANLPNVRALMTTEDATTIQDASADIWKLSGSDLLVLANRAGVVAGLRTPGSELDLATAQGLLHSSLDRRESVDWWFGGGHLYKVRIQPIYFGGEDTTLGLLAVGYQVDERTARDFSKIASSQVVFRFGETPVASTLSTIQNPEMTGQFRQTTSRDPRESQTVQLGEERYLAATVNLGTGDTAPVSLTVLKSLDQATSFLKGLNHVLLGLGLLSVVAGSGLVFLISHTFTRPLESLVAGTRALQEGDFYYPLDSSGGDEVTEVTKAFIGMRSSMLNSQQEQKQLEERLRQAHKMEAVGRLAGGVAHDFNNLLTIIRGNSDLLIDREGSDNFHRKCVEQIQKAAGRAVSMTRQLLAFSRMQVLQPRVLELNGIVSEMGKMLPRLIGEHIEYSFVAEPKLLPVKADPGQIEQVILNLVVNARDAMPSGGRLIVKTSNASVDATEAAKRPPMTPGQYVLLSVTDTGIGMSDETRTHIFEPFFTTKEIGKGTGLGLATVYGVVKQSGGFIWVISSLGNGTTFEIYLPQASGPVSAGETENHFRSVPSGSETVLVVEDEEGVRELACQFLRVKGYTVLEARDGEHGIDIATRHPGVIHAVLSDLIMPRMSGGELAERLKKIRPEIRIAFMSGYSEFSRGDSSQNFPHAPILQKPFSPASLVEIVRGVLTESPKEQSSEKDDCRVT